MLKYRALLALLTAILFPHAWAQPAIPQGSLPKVRSITTEGSTSFEPADLLKQLRLTRVGSVLAPGQLDADIELNLKSFLKEHGFMSSVARWKAEPGADGTVDVRIDVSDGPQYRLGKLEFDGATVFAREQIRTLVDLREGEILNFKKVKSALDQLKRIYADRGYIDWSYIPEMEIGKSTMNLRFTIEEGQRYRVGPVGFVGCGDQEEENRLRSLITLRPGEILRMSDVDASVTALNQLGRSNRAGEADFKIYPNDKEGLVSIVFWLRPKM